MELGKISLFGVIRKRLAWLGQRQEVVAQNIANADTPNYQARILKPFKFREMVRTRVEPVPHEEILDVTAMIYAGAKSLKEKSRLVPLAEVLG